jgi:hypothetical protein
MFAGQTVIFLPHVSKGVGGEEKLFRWPTIILLGKMYSEVFRDLFLHFTHTKCMICMVK